MHERYVLRGLELRYVLTAYLCEVGRAASLRQLLEWLDSDGYDVAGRPGKTVADALRWEIRRRRVVRLGRGWYGPGWMPRQTRYRIRSRVIVVKEKATATRLAAASVAQMRDITT